MSQVDLLSGPIVRDNSGYSRILRILIGGWCFAVIGLTSLTFIWISLPFPLSHTWPLYLTTAVLWAGGYLLFRYLRRPVRSDTLRIDPSGIHLTRDGVPVDYAWTDIARTMEVLTNRGSRSPIYAVQIQVKGRIYGFEEQFDCVRPGQFNISNSDFAAIVRAGVERWGAGPSSAPMIA